MNRDQKCQLKPQDTSENPEASDPVFALIAREQHRQQSGLELIPSENYASAAVLAATGSILTNKYSEGYPGRRYYGGQENIDQIEQLAIDRAKQLFHADHANVQPHSGANANEAVYFAWCEPDDKILAMSLPAGGHLTHGSPVTRSAKIYHFLSYGVTVDGDIDYDELEKIALAEQPKIILIGYSAFMKIPDFARVAKLRDQLPNTLFMADMAHVAGLIAGGAHPNPLDFGFQVMTTTTHKTLRGPRGGLILSKGRVSNPLKKPEHTLENLPTLIDRAVFPGTQGGPLDHIIAAKAVAFGEALRPEFHAYAQQILDNAQALARELQDQGFILQGGGTENHLILIDLPKSIENIYQKSSADSAQSTTDSGQTATDLNKDSGQISQESIKSIDGKAYEQALDRIGITLNANSLPSDRAGSFHPSGVRLGTPAITTRGLGPAEMKQIARWLRQVLDLLVAAPSSEIATSSVASSSGANNSVPASIDAEFAKLRAEVRTLANRFPVPGLF